MKITHDAALTFILEKSVIIILSYELLQYKFVYKLTDVNEDFYVNIQQNTKM